MSFALGANREGKERVNGNTSRIQSSRIGFALVCVRRNAQPRELNLPVPTRFVLSTVMIALFIDGPTGCLVSPPTLSSQCVPSRKIDSVGHGDLYDKAHRLLLATAVPIATMPGAGMGWRKSS